MAFKDHFLSISDPKLFLQRKSEGNELDYKSQLNGTQKGRADFISAVAAMANYGGGVLIFGVNGEELLGVDSDKLQDFDVARLEGRLQKNLSPVPKVRSEIITFKDNDKEKKFPFVSVASIEGVPIIVSNNLHDDDNRKLLLKEGEIYIRQNTQTVVACRESQIRHILEKAINYEVKSRLAVIIPAISGVKDEIIEPEKKIISIGRQQAKERAGIQNNTAVRELLLTPSNGTTIDLSKLAEAFRKKVILLGHEFPLYYGSSKFNKSGHSQDGFIAWYLNSDDGTTCFARQEATDGSFFWIGSLFEDELALANVPESVRFKESIGVQISVYYSVMAVSFAKVYLETLKSSGAWVLTLRLRNVSGRKLLVEDSFGRGGFLSRRETFDDEVSVSIDLKSELLKEDSEKIALKITEEIFKKFNWHVPNTEQLTKDIHEAFARIGVVDELRFGV